MSRAFADTLDEAVKLDLKRAVANLVTEDDEPVDNVCTEKHQYLLTRTLYSSWTPPPDELHPGGKRKFWAAADIAIFPSVHQQPLVPDVFVSLDVEPPADWHETRSYFFWEYGKAPEVLLEIVSNRKGGELDNKLYHYARMGALYYVVYDPENHLSDDALRVHELRGRRYQLRDDDALPELGLRLAFWRGLIEDKEADWLRWCDADGNLLPTPDERAALENQSRRKAEAKLRKEVKARKQAENHAAELAAKLRELGVDPDKL